MRYLLSICTRLSVGIFLCMACSDETAVGSGESGENTAINIGTRAILLPDNPDETISGLRIMAFDTKWHLIQRNRYYTATELSTNLLYSIYKGTYDFVIVANEPRDGIVNTALDGVNTLSDLDNILLPASSFQENMNIPMTNMIRNVEVLTGNRGVLINGASHPIWEITLQRLATRFDLLLYSNTGSAGDFSGITFCNLPDYVPLLGGNYTGEHTGSRVYTVTGNPTHFQPATVSGAAWGIRVNRIILPSNQFAPSTQAGKAVVLKVQLAGGGLTPQCLLGMDEANNDYTLPRNKNFQVTARVDYPVQVNIGVTDWESVNLNGTVYNSRSLNVSALTATVSNINKARIYFFSGEPNVSVSPMGHIGDTGSTTFQVDDVFNNLSGTSATNLHYTSGTNAGYIDIDLKEPNPTAQTYRLYLNANGLLREITVFTVNRTNVTWSNTRFAGTFHRWNQTGERLIYGTDNAGNWSAEVEYPSGQPAFVVLNAQKSLDPNLGTDAPGDAESFKVTNGTSTVSGTGAIYFRVGLSSTLISPTAAPRYARIKVSSSIRGTSYIYVRQGETADYVMRPQDTGGNGESWSSSVPRPKAVRLTNFNLTDPQKTIGKVDRGYQGYTFTSYPSQSGYLFQWFGTVAWSPCQTTPPDWNTQGAPGYWDSYPAWETAPPGYRRPNDGSTSGPVNPSLPDAVANSEIRQSLWYNPEAGGTVSSGNSVYGYYADGFFERRRIADFTFPNQVVEKNYYAGSGADIAFTGLIQYNPRTFSSVFFPCPPRYEWNGSRYDIAAGMYWTSSANLQNALYFGVYSEGIYTTPPALVTYGRNIRCVAN